MIHFAIEASHERLPDVARAPEGPYRGDSLFSGSQIFPQPLSVETRQTRVCVLSVDIAILDQLASVAAARSRSAYVVVALETFFADLDAAAYALSVSAV